MNDQIKMLHESLGKTVRQLSERLGRTSDPQEAEMILREMEEVNFRVMLAGRLLFKATTARIDQRLQEVVAASADVDKSIAEIQKVKDIVKAVGKFLTNVDKILDAAKIL